MKKNIDIIIDGLYIKSKEDIFILFDKILIFPKYFGKNWDAFYDIMINKEFKNQGIINIYIKNINKMFIEINDKKIFNELIKDLNSENLYNINLQL